MIAPKPGQASIPWWDFIWHLCVSKRELNSITHPLKLLFRIYEYTVPQTNNLWHRISIETDFGYCQVMVLRISQTELELFGINEKLTWTIMPIGAPNIWCNDKNSPRKVSGGYIKERYTTLEE